MIDAQSVKTSTSVPARSQGIDAGTKIVGRKRSIVIDTLGLLLAVLVGDGQDLVNQTRLLAGLVAPQPRLSGLEVVQRTVERRASPGGHRGHPSPVFAGQVPIALRWVE